jgi:hypothetical protein
LLLLLLLQEVLLVVVMDLVAQLLLYMLRCFAGWM